MTDERVGGVEYVSVRSIVLLELDHPFDVEVALEVLHVRSVCAAKRVNRLIVVAHRENRVFTAGEELQPAVLKLVRILKFVDEDVLEAIAVVVTQNLVSRQELV